MHFEAIGAIDTTAVRKRRSRAHMENPRLPDPSLIMQLALAYRSSAALFAAAELDVFGALADGPRTAGELASMRQCAEPPMRLLLETCAMVGLLTTANGRYGNSSVVDAFLVPGRPAYSANGLKYAEDLYPAWGRLGGLGGTGPPPA